MPEVKQPDLQSPLKEATAAFTCTAQGLAGGCFMLSPGEGMSGSDIKGSNAEQWEISLSHPLLYQEYNECKPLSFWLYDSYLGTRVSDRTFNTWVTLKERKHQVLPQARHRCNPSWHQDCAPYCDGGVVLQLTCCPFIPGEPGSPMLPFAP